MKTLLVVFLVFAISVSARANWTEDYAQLLKKYVTPEGVRYAAWKKDTQDMAAMDRVADGIASSKESDLAFYINAYNAWILHEALAKYPTRTLKFIFFLPGRIKVGGEKMSFDHLEKQIIRPQFKEPRVHFALNCASQSCPPLLNEPYSKGRLDAQLEKQTRDFVNSDRGVMTKGDKVELSKIFDWYKDDFGGNEAGIKFINKRRTHSLPASAKITYQDYDWNLNEVK